MARYLIVHPGSVISTADVEAGLRYGLQQHGVEIVRYRLDARYDRAQNWLYYAWRKASKDNPSITKPTTADVVYQAGIGALEMGLRHQVDAVIVVSAMFLHPDVIVLMRRAGLLVTVLFTETPYDLEHELKIAELADGCWTHERANLPAFRAVNQNSGYLPHAWHPERHGVETDATVPAHDVVFVGSGFAERLAWFNAIDWRGIDLGLYGSWKGIKASLKPFVKGDAVDNTTAAALYRRAKVGLNLYRATSQPAESLNPRGYELAACGVFHISAYRAEVTEIFGDLVPTFTTPFEASGLLRSWLADSTGRARVAAQLPAKVAESSWTERASRIIGDVEALRLASAAA